MLNFVFLATGYDWYRYMYREIIKDDNVKFFSDITDLLDLEELDKYKRANSITLMQMYIGAMRRIKFNNNKSICFIHFSHFMKDMYNGLLEAEKIVFPNCKQVHFFTDVIHMHESNLIFLMDKMDAVGVYDENVAKKNNIFFWPHAYPMPVLPQGGIKEFIKYDLCFVGNGMGRTRKLIKIAELCAKKKLKLKYI